MGTCIEPNPQNAKVTINCSCFHSTANADVKDGANKQGKKEEFAEKGRVKETTNIL
jgi:hypothetical protein